MNCEAELLKKPDLTLQTAHDYCRTYEATELQKYKFVPQTVAPNPAVYVQPVRIKKEQLSCKFCGYRHSFAHPTRCPAFKKNCKMCNKTGHFAKMCRNKQKKEP